MTGKESNETSSGASPSGDDESTRSTDSVQAAYATGSDTGTTLVSDQPNGYRFPTRRVVLVGVFALILGGVAQWFAPDLDYQNANFVCLAAILIFLLHTLWAFQRSASARGNRLIVPGTLAVVIGLLVGCFRFDGFSGEMFPQYSWRFTPARMELKEVSATEANSASAQTVAAEDGSLDSSTEESSAITPSAVDVKAVAAIDSPQFLGRNRNGVQSERLFAVPANPNEAVELWNQGIGEGWSGFTVVGDRVFTMEQRDELECVTCYRLSDGELLWIDKYEARHQHALGGIGPRATPSYFDGKVYANGATGYLRRLDSKSGKLIWAQDLKELSGWSLEQFDAVAFWGHACSPLIIESLGICVMTLGGPVDEAAADENGITATDKALIALDLETGKERWRAGHDQFSYASPILMKSINQIVSVNEKTLSGHVPETGKQLWSYPWPGATNAAANCASAMIAGDDQFIIGKGYGGGSALIKITQTGGKWDADAVWASSRVLKTKFNHTCILGDVGFGLNNGALQAARISTGESLWNQPRRSRSGQGQVILIDDVLVVQSEYGDVVFVDADETEYRELGRLSPLSSKTWNVPTIAGRHLVVRNDRQAVCYLLPAK